MSFYSHRHPLYTCISVHQLDMQPYTLKLALFITTDFTPFVCYGVTERGAIKRERRIENRALTSPGSHMESECKKTLVALYANSPH